MALFIFYSCLLDYSDSNFELSNKELCREDLDRIEKMCVAFKRISDTKKGVHGPRNAADDLLNALQKINTKNKGRR